MSLTARHLPGCLCLSRLLRLILASTLPALISQATAATNPPVTWRDLQVTNAERRGFTLLAPEQTGIGFINHLNEWASAENRVLNNGSGVAAGDYDNDGLPDLFFCSLNNQNALFKNLGNWRFTNVTAQAGLKFAPMFYRAAVFAVAVRRVPARRRNSRTAATRS